MTDRTQPISTPPVIPLWRLLVVSHLAMLLFGMMMGWFMVPHQPSERYVSEPASIKKTIEQLKAGK